MGLTTVQRQQKRNKNKDILIYCNSGRTSAQAANILTKNGYKHVYNSADGVKEFDFKLVK